MRTIFVLSFSTIIHCLGKIELIFSSCVAYDAIIALWQENKVPQPVQNDDVPIVVRV